MLFSKNAKEIENDSADYQTILSILFLKSPKDIDSVDYQTKESISQWIAKLLKAFNSVYFVIKSAKDTKEIICSMDCKTF